jgi:hypothetical protein
MSEINTGAQAQSAAVNSEPVNAADVPAINGDSSKGGAQTGDVSAAAKEAMRKYKVKVEGRELEVDEKELLRGYSHQKAASKALNEGKALRKQAEEFISALRDKEKLKEVLSKLGHDPRKLSEEILAGHLEDELMDPRDKELRDTKMKLKQIEEMDRQQKEAVKKQREEQLKTKYMKEYETDFVKALETSKLPPTKPMVAEMAKYIARSAKIGFEMTALEAAQLVKEDILQAQQRLIGDSDGEMLIKLLGEDIANKIRKYDTAKLKNPEAGLTTPQNQEPRDRIGERQKKKKPMSQKEWMLHKRGLK